jgi:WD40 repeat protein
MFSYHSWRNCSDEYDSDNYIRTHDSKFFEAVGNHSTLPCHSEHFQLRNCLCSTSKSQLYSICTESGKILKYNPLTREVLPAMTIRKDAKLVSMSVCEPYIAAGGINGELFIADITRGALLVDEVLAEGESCITNYCQFYYDQAKLKLLVCNNDHSIRFIDPEFYAASKIFNCIAPVNHASLSPDLGLVAAALDDRAAYIFSTNDGQPVYKLEGHKDYGFATGWHPLNPYIVATGNQDLSVRLWDLRNGGKQPLACLSAKIGACLSLKFTGNGEFLVFSESADFIHVVDATLFEEEQVIDLFGEISGFAFDDDFSPERLFVGVFDRNYRGMTEFRRNSAGLSLPGLAV